MKQSKEKLSYLELVITEDWLPDDNITPGFPDIPLLNFVNTIGVELATLLVGCWRLDVFTSLREVVLPDELSRGIFLPDEFNNDMLLSNVLLPDELCIDILPAVKLCKGMLLPVLELCNDMLLPVWFIILIALTYKLIYCLYV